VGSVDREDQDETSTRPPADNKRVTRSLLLVIFDMAFIAIAYFLALMMRFDMDVLSIDPQYLQGYQLLIIPYIVIDILCLWAFRLYHSIWTYASTSELFQLIYAWLISQVGVLVIFIITQIRMPLSFWVMGALLGFLFTTAIRFGYRFLRLLRAKFRADGANGKHAENVMIIGAGAAGRDLIREIKFSDKLNWKVVCAIDDNATKKGRYLDGVPIVGGRRQIISAVKEYSVTQIVFSIPTASGSARRDILEICQQTDCKLLAMPGIYQLLDGQVNVSRLREVQIEDLLGRDPVVINSNEVNEFICGKTVLVTGGGGSIGSELCRQIAKDHPKQLVIFDIYENNAYEIQQELLRLYPDFNLRVLIGSVRDSARVNWLFETLQPDIVFHAAAHKHVPLMENSPNEAVKNNIMGTYKVARAALEYGAERFVLISTDKAVNPTNIMGASKRVCEMVVQMMDRRSAAGQGKRRTVFSAVRFGNVLGSNGSVIPLFQEQIAEGGPVTVTDKNIIRYFMTIPEAVGLVLQASYYAKGGEIFVLDMGDPVKIDDMARKLIRLSGLEPDVDINIVYTGLRPGEKLFEEILMDEEGLKETSNKLIHIGSPIEMDDSVVSQQLQKLDEASLDESETIKQLMAEVVPTYKPDLHTGAFISEGTPSANNATADHPAGAMPA
jgi:FlaA1/EpsC-like NDP-sugar epimerase